MSAGALRKVHRIHILVLLASLGCCQKLEYLQTTVKSLRNLRNIQTLRRADVAEVNLANSKHNVADKRHFAHEAPPLSLTKGELTALYEQSLANGHTIKLETGDDQHLHAAVHELDEAPHDNHFPHHDGSYEDKDSTGYYYYYYPINSFLDGTADTHNQVEVFDVKPHPPAVITPSKTKEAPVQTHWHNHQHNVTITSKEKKDTKKFSEKLTQPLFMAVSGFLGMALMTFLTTIFLPKSETKNNTVTNKLPIRRKDDYDNLDDLARFALDAINGRCAERFACELTKTARSFNLEDNRFFKLIRRLVPGGSEMEEKAKLMNQQIQCTAIPCIKKRPNNPLYIEINNPYYDTADDYIERNHRYFDHNDRYDYYNQNRKHIHNNYFETPYTNNQNNRRNTQQKKIVANNNKNQKKNNQGKNRNNKNNNTKKKNESNKKNNNRN